MANPVMITVPLADYERLLEASDADDMLVNCDVCGAWLDRADTWTATTDDFTGCWKAATGGMRAEECKAYRAHALEAAQLKLKQATGEE